MTNIATNMGPEADLTQQLQPLIDQINTEMTAAIGSRGDKSDEELGVELTEILIKYGVTPDPAQVAQVAKMGK